jgi:hypothetical protein
MSPNTFKAETIFNSTGDYFYSCFYDDGTQKFMGKLIINQAQNKNAKSYKPSNTTTAFLLYLLFREDGDGITYGQLTNHINNKFNNVIETDIDSFLNDLKNRYNAIEIGATTAHTEEPDPCHVCIGQKLQFERPSLSISNDSDVRNKLAYGRGQYFYTFRR